MQTNMTAWDVAVWTAKRPSLLLAALIVLFHAMSLFPSREGFALLGANVVLLGVLWWMARKGH